MYSHVKKKGRKKSSSRVLLLGNGPTSRLKALCSGGVKEGGSEGEGERVRDSFNHLANFQRKKQTRPQHNLVSTMRPFSDIIANQIIPMALSPPPCLPHIPFIYLL